MSRLKKIAIIPDTHAPFHDKKAWRLAMRAIEAFGPEILIHLGDAFDFNATSRHRKKPKDERNSMSLGKELAIGRSIVEDMDALGAKRKIFIQGNHEENFERYVADNCKEIFDILPDYRELLGLDDSWEWVDHGDYIRVGKVFYTHDVDGRSGKGALQQVLSADAHNVVIGHTHRFQQIVLGNRFGQPHVGCSFGWLGDPAMVTYMHRLSRNREWAHGFGIGYMQRDGTTQLHGVPIVGGKVVIEGEVIR